MARIILTVLIFLAILVFGLSNFLVNGGFNKKTAKVKIGAAVFSVGVADSFSERRKGLSGREKLGKNEGLLFVFPIAGNYGFWMKDMNFPIDIVWLNGGRVVGVSENLKPCEEGNCPVYYPPRSVKEVLEISAGEAAGKFIKAGDKAEIIY